MELRKSSNDTLATIPSFNLATNLNKKRKESKMKSMFIIVALTSLMFSQTGLEIAQKIDAKQKPKDMKANLTMVLTNKNGKTRTSTIRSVSKDDSKKQIIWFLAPADDKGFAFLKIEIEGR